MQNIDLHNYQDFLLRYIDEELDLRQTEALLAFVALHPAIAEELESLQSTKLAIEVITCPNKAVLYKNIFPVTLEAETIVYPNKQKLFKKEKEKVPVVFLRWWAVGAAAIFIFIVARYGLFNSEAGVGLSKNNISKSSVVKATISTANIASHKNTTTNIAIEINESLASTNIVPNQQNIATNTLESGGFGDVAYHTIQNASTVTTTETTHSTASYTGDIIDVKPTIIAEIMVPSMTGSLTDNNETTETIETIDTETASSNRSVMVGAFEIDKDKFRGLFRKANALFKNKENNKNEK
ncbi:MAG: hypothetical protein RL544_459 [Bacteroidota bacterium]|jgi:hypothetical protein